ncbi:hypothetical protein [Natronorubrum bangense]|uniref:Apea-like HEPN domain-containing protein n=2 Tax=Natronorubrum bangense TaxID=61858 RepID=L9WKH3_9EURY|nr:hypothetical protein [Natronorubrum bangense]ELY49711.1 hypothetical protein C494_06840 [Natronorubrum bangense JCM 10635]QCC55343.1 hypothetical protein DV706_13245 [Natronorubrum bangense]
MDEEKKGALVEMLVANSLPIRMMESETGSDEDDSHDFSTLKRDSLKDLKYNYAMQRLIVDYFNYDSMQVTVNDLQQSVMTALMDLANDPLVLEEFTGRKTSENSDKSNQVPPDLPVQKTVEDDGLVEVFSAKMDVLKRSWGETSSREFTIWFPWHICWGDDPSAFEMYGHTFESADQSEWRPRLEEIARGPDVSGGGYILKEIEKGNYDVWKTTISSRTPRWAMLRFKNALKILSAQLNHSAYFMKSQTRANRLGRMSGDTRGGGRWTAIQRPFGVFYVDEYVDERPYTPHWGANVYHRGGHPEVPLDYSSLIDRFDTHLPFENLRVGHEPLLHDVLVDYQQGLTETDHRRSFINFWRVIEELSLAGQGQKEVTVERALFALELVTDGDYDPIFERVANEIWEVRNTRTHETGWIHIGTEHEIVAKVLADAMIGLYLTEFVDTDGDIDRSKTRRVFKWATKSDTTREETQKALNTLNRLHDE